MTAISGEGVSGLLPHSGSMVLLDRIIEITDEHAMSSLTIRNEGGRFGIVDGQVPSWLALEWMAQTIAAIAGFRASKCGAPVEPGFLLGTRRFETSRAMYPIGDEVVVTASCILSGNNGMDVFSCLAQGDSFRATANVNTFKPKNVMEYLKKQ